MKRLSRAMTRLTASGIGSLWYALLVVVLPTVSLMLIALFALWRNGQLWTVLLSWLVVTGIAYVVFVNLPQRKARRRREAERHALEETDDEVNLPAQLDERSDWSERDSVIWQRRCIAIEKTVQLDPAWEAIPTLIADELTAVATEYHGQKSNARYRFTLPEGLLVLSVASERYRRLVTDSVPFADRIQVASLVSLYERQSQIAGGLTWLDRGRRVLRLINPVSAVIGELRDQLTSRVLSETNHALQIDLKRLLLQEIAQVGIDLYSGRLKVSDAELADYQSQASRDDALRHVEAAEPLRVVLLGQVSAGKSSLVNALVDALEAEVDQLPTTDRTTVHVLQADTDDQDTSLHLVDTPGIDDDLDRQDELIDVAANADLIVWVSRATQPARAPDQKLYERCRGYFEKRPERRMPPILLTLTHIDQLPPRNEWNPPYDLLSSESDRKTDTIRQALQSTAAAIGLPEGTAEIPVSLDRSGGVYNVDSVAAEIMMLADEATLAQFNRRRVERGGDSGGWRARWRQTRALGTAVGKHVLKHARNKPTDR